MATFADDTAILASHPDPNTASHNLQTHLHSLQNWFRKWKLHVNETKSVHVTFTLNRDVCPPVALNGVMIPQADDTKYLGMHLDRRLTWRKHISAKRKQLGLKLRQMYWLIGRNSRLALDSKLLLYKTILKPVWTYGVPLWGTACTSNIEILQRFQNTVLRVLVNAPWYVPNWLLHRDLNIPSVRDVITRLSARYCGRLRTHPNHQANILLEEDEEPRRLKGFKPADLTCRFT